MITPEHLENGPGLRPRRYFLGVIDIPVSTDQWQGNDLVRMTKPPFRSITAHGGHGRGPFGSGPWMASAQAGTMWGVEVVYDNDGHTRSGP